jgi:flavodoxin
MQAIVVYDTQFGNTEQVARAIADGLAQHASVEVLSATEATGRSDWPELIVVGGPTQRHGMSPPLGAFVDSIPRDGLRGRRAAVFDTRYRMPALLSGSAASQVAGRIRRAGCHLLASPESFFVERDRPPGDETRRHGLERLEQGEVERATAWGRSIGAAAGPS